MSSNGQLMSCAACLGLECTMRVMAFYLDAPAVTQVLIAGPLAGDWIGGLWGGGGWPEGAAPRRDPEVLPSLPALPASQPPCLPLTPACLAAVMFPVPTRLEATQSIKQWKLLKPRA